MEIKKEKFKNRKRTRITISYYFYENKESDIIADISVLTVTKPHSRYLESESMPIIRISLLASFSDYREIINEVLVRDKVARRWFRKKVREIVLEKDPIVKLGDFISPSDKLNRKMVEDYCRRKRNEREIRSQKSQKLIKKLY